MNQQDWEDYYAADRPPWLSADAVLVEETALLAPGRALEYACGEGSDTLHLATLGFEVTAVDYASSAVDIVNHRAAERGLAVRAEVGDVTTYVAEGPFDLGCMIFLHLEPASRRAAIASLTRAIRTGGVFLYVGLTGVPNERCGEEAPTLFPGPDVVADLLTGFTVERAEVIRRTMPMPDDEDFEADSVILRARRTGET